MKEKDDIGKIVQAFEKVSIEMKQYALSCQLLEEFRSVKVSYKILFDILFMHFRDYSELFDAKIHLLRILYPHLNELQSNNLLRILQKVLNKKAE